MIGMGCEYLVGWLDGFIFLERVLWVWLGLLFDSV